MKKLISVFLSLTLCLVLFGCTGNTGTTSDPDTDVSDNTVSKDDISDGGEDISYEPDDSVNSDTSETSDETLILPPYISNFVSWAAVSTSLRATDSTSLRLTAVNKPAGFGDIALFTYDYTSNHAEISEGELSDYAVMVAEYDPDAAGVVKTAYYAVGEYTDAVAPEIPDDGFVILAHRAQDTMIKKFSSFDGETALYVAGVQICDVGYSITSVSSPITVDGVVDGEWKSHLIDTIDADNELWTYSNFESGDFYTNAEYYVTYDSDYLYFAVVVSSPYHYCPITAENAGSMWQYECIQVKVSIESPKSDYILTHYDHVVDPTANNEGVVRSYGFAVNDNGETCYYENSPVNGTFLGKAKCVRDDAAQTTVYEVAIPWDEYGADVSELESIGFTFSINSTNETDVQNGTWRNLILRDGGGVIGRNDWAKIPVVTISD